MKKIYDIAVIGGGINGAGIARDAAGRGLSVFLCERGDLAQGTSSASTKLIHGGLRYLEFYEFRLVREALMEREVLLRSAPHIIWPLSFVLPHYAGLRPAWILRLGLFIYDHLGGRKLLPKSYKIDLRSSRFGKPLKKFLKTGFVYSDCWVEDSRLVVLAAIDAAKNGADIRNYTSFVSAKEKDDHWVITLEPRDGEAYTIKARTIVNAGKITPLRLVKGSHIVVPKLYEGEQAYILQNADRRMIFIIPFEQDYSLIGTTDRHVDEQEQNPQISDEEIDYLLEAVNAYVAKPVVRSDIVYTYSGIRPLFDDGVKNNSRVTRDYTLELTRQGKNKPNVLSVYGGKITTFRRLAEEAVTRIIQSRGLPQNPQYEPWTHIAILTGGDIGNLDMSRFVQNVRTRYEFLTPELAERLCYTYGTRLHRLLQDCTSMADLGQDFGGDEKGALTAKEVDYLLHHEWVRDVDDILFRRTRLGMIKGLIDRVALDAYVKQWKIVNVVNS
jgi:glycerol-3-phosphate dehydrogenase